MALDCASSKAEACAKNRSSKFRGTSAMNDPLFKPHRRLVLQAGVAAALAAAAPMRAQSAEAGAPPGGVSPVMRTVADYIVGTAQRALPEAAAEATRHHLLDTLAAMI